MQNATDVILNTVTTMNLLKDLMKAEGNESLSTYAKDIDRVNMILSRLHINIALYLKDHSTSPVAPSAPSVSTSTAPAASTPTTPIPKHHKSTASEYFSVNEANVHLLNRRAKIIIDVIRRMLVSPTTEKDVKAFMKSQPDLYNAFMTHDNGESYKTSFYASFREHMEQIREKQAVI